MVWWFRSCQLTSQADLEVTVAAVPSTGGLGRLGPLSNRTQSRWCKSVNWISIKIIVKSSIIPLYATISSIQIAKLFNVQVLNHSLSSARVPKSHHSLHLGPTCLRGKHQIGRGKEGRRKNHETWNMFNLVWSSTFRAFTTFPFTRKFKSEGKAFLCIHASRLAGLGLLDLPGSTERLTPLLDFSVATLYPRKTLSAQAKSQCMSMSRWVFFNALTCHDAYFATVCPNVTNCLRMFDSLKQSWPLGAVTAVWQKLFLQGHSLSWRTTSWDRFGLFSKKCSWSACDPTTARTFSHWVGIASVSLKAC